ncbi:Cytochrome P450 78A5 [Glycine soja]
MVKELVDLVGKYGVVEVRKVLHFGSLSNVMKSVFGRSYVFGEGVMDYDLLGVFNWSDHFLLFGWLDLQGVRKRYKSLVDKVNAFVGKIILKHRVKMVAQGEDKTRVTESSGDFIDVTLDLEKEKRLQHHDMVVVLWEMIFRGTYTATIILERNMSDDDLPNLPYVCAIVKETPRMHSQDPFSFHGLGFPYTTIGTTAMVNMWAITHDQDVDTFCFLKKGLPYKSHGLGHC